MAKMYTFDDLWLIAGMKKKGFKAWEIAEKLGRTTSAINYKIQEMSHDGTMKELLEVMEGENDN